jgi:hypothetical protein
MDMTQVRRELILRFCDDRTDVFPFAFHLNAMVRCDEILRWLIKNRITGKHFLDWVRFHHNYSILKAAAFVMKEIDRNAELRPIIGGKDYLLR